MTYTYLTDTKMDSLYESICVLSVGFSFPIARASFILRAQVEFALSKIEKQLTSHFDLHSAED